jgi:dipeptidyl aminopeptidase/acylaminoacyl peptidase
VKTNLNFPRPLWLLIAFVVIGCFVASFRYERAEAQLANGKIACVNESVLFTMNSDGSNMVQLTPPGVGLFDHNPVWSPDGTKIAVGRATFTGKSQIYVMSGDGTNPVRITNNSASDRQPSWSPDGSKIAFVSDRDGNDEIYLMNADGSNQTRLTNNSSLDFDTAWSPDGTKIAFTTDRDSAGPPRTLEIYVMNTDGSNQTRLTNNSAIDAQPSWSPDGTKIAFLSQRDNIPLVYVMNADGTNQVNITHSTTLDSADPEWSPDGTTIAFTSYNRVGQTNSDEVFLMNADGSNVRRITTTSLDEHELAWQPLGAAPTPTPSPSPTPTPSPTPSFTITGVVKDGSGNALSGVTMILQNNTADTQIVFTDQNGNYLFHYSGGNSLFVTPSKQGFVFNPLSIGFGSTRSVTGDQTADFTGTTSLVPVGVPILLGRDTPQHAIGLDSVWMVSEPFKISNTQNFSADQHTRITLLAVNLDLSPGETLSAIEAQAEDSLGGVFPLTVEFLGAVPGLPWLKQVVVKLPDEIANKVEVRVSVKVHTFTSNKVIIGVDP